MILDKLKIKEYDAERSNTFERSKQEAVKTISRLLTQIDYSTEVVPDEDPERLIKLLVSLKGDQLSSNEVNLVYEIASR